MTTGTHWNRNRSDDSSGNYTPSFDDDDSPDTYSAEERRRVIAIWRAVAEDFLPFDVDVTTGRVAAAVRPGMCAWGWLGSATWRRCGAGVGVGRGGCGPGVCALLWGVCSGEEGWGGCKWGKGRVPGIHPEPRRTPQSRRAH